MAMQTSAQVRIGRPAAEVFRWLVEPGKLTAWVGATGAMPADPADLRVGYEGTGSVAAIAGGEAQLRVDVWDPPRSFGFTMSYPGGESRTTYLLEEAGGATTLTTTSDTDWARPDRSAVEAQLAQQPAETQAAMRDALALMDSQVGAGGYDETARAAMQSALEDSLAKLRQLAES